MVEENLVPRAVVFVTYAVGSEVINSLRVLGVSSVELVRTTAKGVYPSFAGIENKWAEQYNWSLYSGKALVAGDEHEVYGWSFTGKLPIFWGCDMFEWRPRGDLSAWAWLSKGDDVENDVQLGPGNQDAASHIIEKLGTEVLEEYLKLALDKP
jgi:hypothetical protein